MLSDAYENWVARLSEREFDEQFFGLLRSSGFFDIHFTHGAYEFGKDFIAKRVEDAETVQYGFQSKAGSIAGGEWEKIVGQLHELIDTWLVHPNFDPSLKCVFVLLTTGRLKGKAVLAAKQFAESRVRTTSGHDFRTYELDQLRELVEGAGPFSVPSAKEALSVALGQVAAGESSDLSLERVLQSLLPEGTSSEQDVWRSLVDNSVIASVLLDRELPFQALTVALNGIRIAAVAAHGQAAEASGEILGRSMAWYLRLCRDVLRPLLDAPDDVEVWCKFAGDPLAGIVSYPVICHRTLEYLGLAAIDAAWQGDDTAALEHATLCQLIASAQPGCSHPISDRYAASFAPPVIAMARYGLNDAARTLVVKAVQWLCDRYEQSEFGLADALAEPAQEVATLLGAPFEFIDLQKRRESLLAVALADLSYLFFPDIFSDVLNDFEAVGLIPSAVHVDDVPDGYAVVQMGRGTQALINVSYPESKGESALAHHKLQKEARTPERLGGPAVVLALACLARDRLFSDCYARAAADVRSEPAACTDADSSLGV